MVSLIFLFFISNLLKILFGLNQALLTLFEIIINFLINKQLIIINRAN